MEPYEQVRSRISLIKNFEIGMFLKAAYLLGAQGCELTGKPNSYEDATSIYGPRGTDVSKVTLKLKDNSDIIIGLFRLQNLQNSKRDVLSSRIVALPLSNSSDDWTEELFSFFESKGNEYVFQFPLQNVGNYITKTEKIFGGLTFQTRTYKYGKFLICDSHRRLIKIHHLPILRSYELADKYGFDSSDLMLYTGINYSKMELKNRNFDNQNWCNYIQKLMEK
jgi:hypothetical protein